MQLESFLQNEIVNFPFLMLMANLFSITLIKLFLFFLSLVVAFSSVYNLLLSCVICFSFCFECIYYSLYTNSLLIEVNVTIYLQFIVNQLLFCLHGFPYWGELVGALVKNLFILLPGRIPLVDTDSHRIFILPPRVHPPPLAPTYNFHVITQQKFNL